MLLFVDMVRKECRLQAVPPSLRRYGGRALASLLASGEGVSPTPGIPRQRSCLILAPGLLAGTKCASAGRCAVICALRGDSRIGHSNAGGSLAPALARCGVKAVILEGEHRADPRYDLVIDPSGGRLVPVASPDPADAGVTATMHAAALCWPDAAGILTACQASLNSLPIASTTFSNEHLRPISHAGSGSGMVMGSAGLRALVVLKATPADLFSAEEDRAAVKAFARSLRACRSQADDSGAMKKCSANCFVACRRGSDEKKTDDAKKWPGYDRWWRCGDEERDAACTARYAALCDDMGVDAFALGMRLETLARQGMLPPRDPASALREVQGLAQSPSDAMLLPWLTGWTPDGKEETPFSDADRQAVIMDTLGICRFAMDAVNRVPDVAEAFSAMLLRLFHLQPAEFRPLAERVLHAERGDSAGRESARQA